jgi:hypothetical protein
VIARVDWVEVRSAVSRYVLALLELHRIRAVTLAERTGVLLDTSLMSPGALDQAKPLELTDWDREWLERLPGGPEALEPLRAEIVRRQVKGEQETIHAWLDQRLRARVAAA